MLINLTCFYFEILLLDVELFFIHEEVKWFGNYDTLEKYILSFEWYHEYKEKAFWKYDLNSCANSYENTVLSKKAQLTLLAFLHYFQQPIDSEQTKHHE